LSAYDLKNIKLTCASTRVLAEPSNRQMQQSKTAVAVHKQTISLFRDP
jgi:hypothetical protein